MASSNTNIVLSILKKSWTWCIIAPFLASCFYFYIIATDRYVGEAKVIVKQADNGSVGEFDLPLFGSSVSSERQDAYLVREYILSLDMLHDLDKELALRDHYQSKDADIISRLWTSESKEAFLKYYRKHLQIDYDDLSGVLTIRAQAFNPQYAQKIVQTLLKHSEEYINQISHRLANEQVVFVEQEIERAADHLKKSKQNILAFQEEYRLFSPEQESGAKLQVVNELDAELTRSRAELNNLQSYMNESSAEILALKARIGALENQLAIERKKLVGTDNDDFSEINARYAELHLDLEFATDLYKTSLISLEQARVEAYKKLKHLVIVDSPSLAEEAEYPRKLYNIISILVISSLLYGAARIIIATILEHRDV